MQQRYLVGALAVALAALAVGSADAVGGQGGDTDRVMVKVKKGGYGRMHKLLKGSGAKLHHGFEKDGLLAVTVPVAMLDQLKADPDVLQVEVDAPRYPAGQTTPWGIPRVQAPETVAAGADGSGIKVCVIDSGINANHEEFAGVAMNGDAAEGQDWFTDSCGHGTHVAGTIAAASNGTGVVGVSPGKVALHIVKVFDGAQCGWSYSSDLIAAARKCEEAGADIINMSLSGPNSTSAERDEFARLASQDILSIAAAGNDGNSDYAFPASYDSVVAVGALDQDNAHASFSQYTPQVELSAPGVGVLSTLPFRDSRVSVAGEDYISVATVGAAQAIATGALIDGGTCTAAGLWSGRVVLCERGDNTFLDKADAAAAGGAVAMILYNNAPGGFAAALGDGSSAMPVVSISQEDGQALVAGQLGTDARVSTVPEADASGYGYKDGTSMATPHVAGVAALAWSADPSKGGHQVREALGATALDVDAPGRDANTGWGLVQALAATDELLGMPSEPPPPSPPVYLDVDGQWQKGNRFTSTLTWSGGAARVDILRNGIKVQAATDNTGSTVDILKSKNHGTLVYSACNAGTSDCSSPVTINY